MTHTVTSYHRIQYARTYNRLSSLTHYPALPLVSHHIHLRHLERPNDECCIQYHVRSHPWSVIQRLKSFGHPWFPGRILGPRRTSQKNVAPVCHLWSVRHESSLNNDLPAKSLQNQARLSRYSSVKLFLFILQTLVSLEPRNICCCDIMYQRRKPNQSSLLSMLHSFHIRRSPRTSGVGCVMSTNSH